MWMEEPLEKKEESSADDQLIIPSSIGRDEYGSDSSQETVLTTKTRFEEFSPGESTVEIPLEHLG